MAVDEEAIHGLVKRMETAWNAGDSEMYAAPFAEDVAFIHVFGGQLDGRSAVEASHRHIFQTMYKGSHVSFTVLSMRFVRPDVAVVFCRAHIKFYEGTEAREMDTRPTFVMAKEHGNWQVVAFQNTRISEIPGAGR